MKGREFADQIASDIFDVGSEPSRGTDGIVQRIAFKGGRYNDNETELGGLCEKALAERIHISIKNILS